MKFHGYGNDYLVVETEKLTDGAPLSEFTQRICDRHYGAGADGVAIIGDAKDEDADFSLRIFNPDGSEAAMSGNGSRCAAAYLYHEKLWSGDELRFRTRAGVKRYQLINRGSGKQYEFEAEIGRPRFDSASIPVLAPGENLARVIAYPLQVEDLKVPVTALQMCNPNCCVFVEDFDRVDWRQLGRAIERHEQFPERTNVEFVRIVDRHEIEVRIWERGVGETSSSGTGACAAAVASSINDFSERRVAVKMPGGEVRVNWRVADDEVLLTGIAESVYRGEWPA